MTPGRCAACDTPVPAGQAACRDCAACAGDMARPNAPAVALPEAVEATMERASYADIEWGAAGQPMNHMATEVDDADEALRAAIVAYGRECAAEAEARTWAKARSSTFVDAALAAEREAGRAEALAEVDAVCEAFARMGYSVELVGLDGGEDWGVVASFSTTDELDVRCVDVSPTAAILAAAAKLPAELTAWTRASVPDPHARHDAEVTPDTTTEVTP